MYVYVELQWCWDSRFSSIWGRPFIWDDSGEYPYLLTPTLLSRDLRQELIQQKERLHEEMIDELHRHLYVKASARKVTTREQAALTSDTQGTSSPLMSRRQTACEFVHSRYKLCPQLFNIHVRHVCVYILPSLPPSLCKVMKHSRTASSKVFFRTCLFLPLTHACM